jgi:hypothetical protein
MAPIRNNILFLIKIAIYAAFARVIFACAYYIYFIRSSRMPLYSFDGESGSVMAWYIALLLKGVNVMALPVKFIPIDSWVADRIHVIIASFNGMMPPASTYGVGVYSYVLGAFYYIFGYAPLLFRFINIFVCIVTAFICYKIAKDIFGEKVGRIAFTVLLFMPYQFIYSASLQRDTIINCLCAMAVLIVLSIKGSDKLRIKLAYLSMLGVLASIGIYFLASLYRGYKRLFIASAVILISIPAFRMKLFHFIKDKLVTLLTHHISFASYGGSIYKLFPFNYYIFLNPDAAPSLTSLTAIQMIGVMFKSFIAFLTEPVVIRDFKKSYLFVLPEMLAWYFVVAFGMIGAVYAFRNMDLRRSGLLIFIIMFSLVIGMSGANMDALIRHRGMISFAYVIYAAYGISIIKDIATKDPPEGER